MERCKKCIEEKNELLSDQAELLRVLRICRDWVAADICTNPVGPIGIDALSNDQEARKLVPIIDAAIKRTLKKVQLP